VVGSTLTELNRSVTAVAWLTKHEDEKVVKLKRNCFNRDASMTRARLTLSDRNTGMKLGQITVQAATSGECELTKFAFSCVRSMVPPGILGVHTILANAYLLVAQGASVQFI